MRLALGLLLAVSALVSPSCFAKEVLHLSTGFDLVAESHTLSGDQVLVVTGSGSLQLPQSQILDVEVIPDLAAAVDSLPPAANTGAESVSDMLKRIAHSQGTAPEFDRLVRSIALAESSLRQDAVSPKGAIGLMQLMPATAKALGVETTNAEQNAKGGAQLIAELLAKYRYDSVLAIAAYNAGTEAVRKYGGLPPFPETQAYVRRVLRIYDQLSRRETAGTLTSAH